MKFTKKVEKIILKNGLTIILCPVLNSGSVYVNLAVQAGPVYESVSNNGISHFAEHLLSQKVLDTLPNHSWIKNYFDDIFSAYTCINRSNYECTVHPDDLEVIVKIMAMVLQYKDFSCRELNHEKKIIRQEIAEQKNDEDIQFVNFYSDIFFKNHPLSQSVCGHSRTLNQITVASIRKFLREIYQPANCILTLSGNFNPSKVIQIIKKEFKVNLPKSRPVVSKPFKGIKPGIFFRNKKSQLIFFHNSYLIQNSSAVTNIKLEFFTYILRNYFFHTMKNVFGTYTFNVDLTPYQNLAIFDIQTYFNKSRLGRFCDLYKKTREDFFNQVNDGNFDTLKENYIKFLTVENSDQTKMADLISWYYVTYKKVVDLDEHIRVIDDTKLSELISFYQRTIIESKSSFFIEGNLSKKDKKVLEFINI